jgi:hypothetical protein
MLQVFIASYSTNSLGLESFRPARAGLFVECVACYVDTGLVHYDRYVFAYESAPFHLSMLLQMMARALMTLGLGLVQSVLLFLSWLVQARSSSAFSAAHAHLRFVLVAEYLHLANMTSRRSLEWERFCSCGQELAANGEALGSSYLQMLACQSARRRRLR